MAIVFVRGIKFPFQKSGKELPAQSEDEVTIGQSLRQLLLLPRGARVMRPNLGTNIYAFLFENNDRVLEENIKSDIASAISRYEPRIIVLGIDVARRDSSVDIYITYAVKSTNIVTSESIQIPMPAGEVL